jgi:hypothetical protein
MRARVDMATLLSWERGSQRSANLTAVCQTVLGGKGSILPEPTVGLFLVKKLMPWPFRCLFPFLLSIIVLVFR